MSKSAKKWLKMAIQVVVSVCLVAFVLWKINIEEIKSLVLRSGSFIWLAAAWLLFNFSKIAGALRLNVYQRHASILLSELENLRLYYVGMFLNFFLPGGIGGDGYKILVLHRRQEAPFKKLLLITLADRISGLLILLLLLCLLMPMLDLPWSAGNMLALAGISSLVLVAVFILGHRFLLKAGKAQMMKLFGYGLAVQLLQLASMASLLAFIQAPTHHYLAYFAVFLVSSVAAVLPISFGGLGAREITFFYALSLLHLDPAYGVVASSGFFLITLISSLPGILFLGGFSLRQLARPDA